jgi:hypothetical protein
LKYANDNDLIVVDSIHAISTQIAPNSEKSSGIESLEWYNSGSSGNNCGFGMFCFQSLTGLKIILIVSSKQAQNEYILKRIYELYCDFVLKNPFHTLEMPIRSEKFDIELMKLIKQWNI